MSVRFARSTLGLAALLGSLAGLHGCAATAVTAGAATTTNVAVDRRTAGTMLDDQTTETNVMRAIGDDPELHEVIHVNTTVINGVALLTGEVPTQELLDRTVEIARNVPNVRKVHNEMEVMAQTTMLARTNDSLLTGRVKTALLGVDIGEGARTKVVTERGVVYLMGLVTRDEAHRATEAARRVGGVQRVITLFEYVD